MLLAQLNTLRSIDCVFDKSHVLLGVPFSFFCAVMLGRLFAGGRGAATASVQPPVGHGVLCDSPCVLGARFARKIRFLVDTRTYSHVSGFCVCTSCGVTGEGRSSPSLMLPGFLEANSEYPTAFW